MKLDARPTPLYLQKLSSHGAVGALPACMTTETIFDVLACCGLHTLVLVTTKTVHNDLTGSWTEVVDLVQNRPLWRLHTTVGK